MSKIGQNPHAGKKLLNVGITGGIGSGKTTVCRIFETLGIPVYYADERAKTIMLESEAVVKKITALFGNDAYLPDGSLNKTLIAGIVFQDKNKLEKLNAIVHPAVLEDSLRWQANQAGAPYTLKEAALLFESGSYQFLDRTITVAAPEKLRIERVVQRDGTSEEQVRSRIKNQWPEEKKIQLADFVILNDGSRSLVKQVWHIHRELCNIAGNLPGD
jgi:dephospho-CoA kinase